MNKKPHILNTQKIAESRLFTIEQLKLEFSNGEQRQYERISTHANGAVLIIPCISDHEIIMIREYSAGTDRYELVFPKGLVDKGESIEQAAQRELREEIGYGAESLQYLRSTTVSPGYMAFETHLLIAQNLFNESLEGDEPEPLEQVTLDLDCFDDLLKLPELTEARSIAALYMIRDYLRDIS